MLIWYTVIRRTPATNFWTATTKQCIRQRSTGTWSLLHLPAHTCGRGHPRAAAAGCVSHWCFGGSVWCGFPTCLLQTQVRIGEYFGLFVADLAKFSFKTFCIINKKWYSISCRLQMLDHFAECIKQAKGVRQQAVQLNIFTAVLSALKVRKISFTLLSRTGRVIQ